MRFVYVRGFCDIKIGYVRPGGHVLGWTSRRRGGSPRFATSTRYSTVRASISFSLHPHPPSQAFGKTDGGFSLSREQLSETQVQSPAAGWAGARAI